MNIEISFTLCGAILGFCWVLIDETVKMIVFSAVFGFCAGAISTIAVVIAAALCPTIEVIGVRMGMLLVPWASGLLLGEPLAGVILASSSSWWGLQTFTGTMIMTAALLAIAVRVTKHGPRLRQMC